MGNRHSREAGFTLIEIMVVVAIIAVLAMIVIPQWSKTAQKGKADPEIRGIFTEIQVKEEQYRAEGTGVYRDLTQCPTNVNVGGVDLVAQSCFTTAGNGWLEAHITPPNEKTVRCRYYVHSDLGSAQTGGNAISVPAGFTTPSNASNFTGAWYYVVGECDMDGQGGTNATFLSTSWDSTIQKQNYGQ
jgi:prepilin-type N-terminal cleavage/methylation domain-containing protein